MTETLREFLPQLRRQLGLFVPRATFLATCAFIAGYRWGSSDASLDGFHDWLLERGNGRSELGWPWLVLSQLYSNERLPDIATLTEAEDQDAIERLFDLLAEYLVGFTDDASAMP